MKNDLEKFLAAVLDIQIDTPEESITAERLKSVAIKAGLTEDDWKRICFRLNGHLEKGRNFLASENYSDSINELKLATHIAPYRTDVLIDCSRAYFGQWKSKPRSSLLEEAEKLTEKSLAIDPEHRGAAALLSEIRRAKSKRLSRRRWMLTLAAIVLIMGGYWACSEISETWVESRFVESVAADSLELEKLMLSQPWQFRSPQNTNRLDFNRDGTIRVSGDYGGTWHWEITDNRSILITQTPYIKCSFQLVDMETLRFKGRPKRYKRSRYLTPLDGNAR